MNISGISFYKTTSPLGGTVSQAAISSNTLWPDVNQNELAHGIDQYRKLFIRADGRDLAAPDTVLVYLADPGPAMNRVVIFPGTTLDTLADIDGHERLYGGGASDAAILEGASAISVNVGSARDAVFRGGDLIRVSDGGNVDYVRLAAQNAVSWNGTRATLTFAGGETVQNGYQAGAHVSSCIEVTPSDAAVPVWMRRIIPPGIATLTNTSPTLGVELRIGF